MVKLYVCWTTIQTPRPPRGHPCHNAYKALRDAGYDPEVINESQRIVEWAKAHPATPGAAAGS